MDSLDFHRQIDAALLPVGQNGGRRAFAPGIETRPDTSNSRAIRVTSARTPVICGAVATLVNPDGGYR
ncbi:hypothetical protein [Nocardia sp. SYP-A9097]|uniref:hypothetical protein n=1 Tax=Nocardia sp. SYP-A9097 TaxID=2663237 RepID=UPI0018914F05|nr:hypothetical protein [Nocardia sp. SYP-A9097]